MNKTDKNILPTQKLDAVLLHLQERKDDSHCFYGYILPKSYDRPIEIKINQRELGLILDKLHNDGYVKLYMQGTEGVSQDVAHYAVNFDGEVFIQNGGYTQEYENQLLIQEKTKSDLRMRKIIEWTVAIGAIVTAIATTGIYWSTK